MTGILLIALAAVSWGTTGSVMTVLAGAGVDPLVTGAARMAVAAALLVAGAGAVEPLRLGPGDRPRVLAMGLCMAGYQAAYFTAVTLTGIVVTALIAICSAPLMIAALAPVTLGERPAARTLAALALGVAGTALLIGDPRGSTVSGPGLLAGGALALAAGLAYALYVVLAKAALARSRPLPLTAGTFAVAAVVLAPALAWSDAPLLQLGRGWPWLLYLGGVATAGAYAIYAIGLRRVEASAAGIVTLLEPLTATLLGVLIFGERLGGAGALGAALLAGAMAVLLSGRAGPVADSRSA